MSHALLQPSLFARQAQKQLLGDYLLPYALLLKNSGQKSLSGGYAKALVPIHQCYAKRPLVTHVIYANHENYNFLNFWLVKKTPVFHLFTCQVVIGQFVIRRFVIEQVKKANHIKSCSVNQPITLKVVI